MVLVTELMGALKEEQAEAPVRRCQVRKSVASLVNLVVTTKAESEWFLHEGLVWAL